MYDNVYIGKSKICNGIGIFARKNINKNDIITWYSGIIVNKKCIKHDKNFKYNKYVIEYNSVNKRKYVIGISNINQIKGKGFAQFANDTVYVGLTSKNNNSYFIQKGRYILLIAFKNIRKNEEILVPYGMKYWMKEINIKHNINIYNHQFKKIINILHYLIDLVEYYFLCDVYECKEVKNDHKIYFELFIKKRWCICYNIWHYDENFYISFKRSLNDFIEIYYNCLTCKNKDFNFLIDKTNLNISELINMNK